MNFLEFATKIRAVVFPKDEAENLVAVHRQYIEDGLTDIQRWVKCFRAKNTNVYPQCMTMYHCGITVLDAPHGFIERVYTIDQSSPCNRIWYRKVSRSAIESMADKYKAEFCCITPPDQAGLPALPLGLQFAGVESDMEQNRSSIGYWAVDRGRLYVWPHILSTELLVVEWNGLKDGYSDYDEVFDSSARVQRAVREYLQIEDARDISCDSEKLLTHSRAYRTALADLVWECRKQHEDAELPEEPSSSSIHGFCAGTTTNTTTAMPCNAVIGVIGNYGVDTTDESDVQVMVQSWNPDFVLTTGGNNYQFGAAATIDDNIGKYWSNLIYPYAGAYSSTATFNKFFPAFGDTDVSDNGYTPQSNYFTLPNNERYYDFVRGPVHVFVLNSLGNEPDSAGGFASASHWLETPQGKWFRLALSRSVSTWKIVVFNAPIYTSTPLITPATYLRLPYREFGVDLVLTGKANSYERLDIDGLPVIVNGAGGYQPLDTAPAEFIPESKTFNGDENGALRITVNRNILKGEYFGLLSAPTVPFDSFEIHKSTI